MEMPDNKQVSNLLKKKKQSAPNGKSISGERFFVRLRLIFHSQHVVETNGRGLKKFCLFAHRTRRYGEGVEIKGVKFLRRREYSRKLFVNLHG